MRTVTVHLKPAGGGFQGLDVALLELETTEPDLLLNFDWYDDGTITLIYRLVGDDIDELTTLLDGLDRVYEYQIVEHEAGTVYLIVHHDVMERLDRILTAVDDHGVLLEPPFEYTDEGLVVTASGDPEAIQELYLDVSEEVGTEVLTTNEFAPVEKSALQRLTDRQYEALTTAHELGYYESPRAASFEDVAEALDCAPSTANELLRRAESSLISSFLRE
jgi:predicted DNA binding protein